METRIRSLQSGEACRILQAMVRPLMRADIVETTVSPALREALSDAFGVPLAGAAVPDDEIAREALVVLADDPQRREALEAMIENPPPQRYDMLETVSILVAALVVLQTHVRVEKKTNGKWTVLVDKQPTKDALLKPLVEKLMGLLPGITAQGGHHTALPDHREDSLDSGEERPAERLPPGDK